MPPWNRPTLQTPGFFWRMVLANPAFDGMGATPCFQALLSRIEKHIAAARVRIDAMVHAESAAEPAPASPDHGVGAAT